MRRLLATFSAAATALLVTTAARADEPPAAANPPPAASTAPPTAAAPPSASTAAPAPASKEEDETPVEHYRKMSFSLTSGMDLVTFLAPYGWTGFATQFGNTSAQGIVGLGASARGVFSGVVVGAEFGVFYFNGLTSDAVMYPGLSVGYAIPILDRLAITPSFHSIFVLSTASGSSAALQLTGEVGAEIFLGKHGFIEPVLSMGDFHNTANSQGTFIFGVGYRLGVVF